jgi:hypothetical protein
MITDQKSLERQLHQEGFLHTYVWQDGSNAFYPDHTHATETAHIILDGEMTLTQAARPGRTKWENAAMCRPGPRIPRRWDLRDAGI